ncbi:MAG: DUF4124 domain-containing protein [Methylovulum sp.]|uniref:DUF4124 domain-containing protein n=1 Tax=Methylovulum sp. TaxID=1916980 RepID=UPI0026053269|nr:DUF4124 domain-containing protein [Methylovulum sp.]MDD2722474.1 DUF4124 domain-containing protein [Methylovulum sp.]MDD5125316.1 DUF4124 domain-containing protein [Methylovulum sp.]
MKLILFVLASLFVMNASAGVYKCTDSSGNKVYRSSPCVEGYNNTQIDLKTGKSVDLDEEKKLQLLKIKEQQQQEELQKLEQQQENLRKLQIINESKKNQLLIKENPNKFSAYAIAPYELEKLTPLVKLFQSRLAEIEHMRGVAAQKALTSGQCNRVESSELNEKSTKALLVFLVDCSNTKSFYFDEKQLTQ